LRRADIDGWELTRRRYIDILATYEELKKSMKLSKNIHIIDVDVQFVLKKLFFFSDNPSSSSSSSCSENDVEANLLCWQVCAPPPPPQIFRIPFNSPEGRTQAQNDIRFGRLWCTPGQVLLLCAS
jgi:hypothetical protein